jgi:hypothetical protein
MRCRFSFCECYKSEIPCISFVSPLRPFLPHVSIVFTNTSDGFKMFGLIKPTLFGSLIVSTMSAFAEGFEQGRNRVAAPVSEVTTTSSSQNTEIIPVDRSRIASWAYEEASLEAAGFLPGSTTLVQPAAAAEFSACSTFASPGCGIEAATPAVAAFELSSSSVAEIIEGIDVSSSTFPEFGKFSFSFQITRWCTANMSTRCFHRRIPTHPNRRLSLLRRRHRVLQARIHPANQ